MKTDKVINGVLIKATQPEGGYPYEWPEGVTKIGEGAFYDWNSFNRPNSRRYEATNEWLRIDNWVFAGCYSGTIEQLRKRLDSGATTPKREKAFEEISKPYLPNDQSQFLNEVK